MISNCTVHLNDCFPQSGSGPQGLEASRALESVRAPSSGANPYGHSIYRVQRSYASSCTCSCSKVYLVYLGPTLNCSGAGGWLALGNAFQLSQQSLHLGLCAVCFATCYSLGDRHCCSPGANTKTTSLDRAKTDPRRPHCPLEHRLTFAPGRNAANKVSEPRSNGK